jgi:hypothetical protein
VLAQELNNLFKTRIPKSRSIDQTYLESKFDKNDKKLYLNFTIKDKLIPNLNTFDLLNCNFKSYSKIKNKFSLINIFGFSETLSV